LAAASPLERGEHVLIRIKERCRPMALCSPAPFGDYVRLEGLQAPLDTLSQRGDQVIGPTLRGAAIVYDDT
jgi:hypothetical protein